jgi:Spy/CpxP family protein refolding chaperone
MSWIRMAVAGLALCATASIASAQGAPAGAPQGPPPGGPQGGPGGRPGMNQVFEGITLTDAQQTQIQTIRDKYREEMRALFPNGRPQSLDDATRAKLDDIRAKQNAEIRAALTADQQPTFDKNLAEQKKRMEEMQKKNQQ